MILHLLLSVEEVCVGPLQHFSALDDRLTALNQELALSVGEVQMFD